MASSCARPGAPGARGAAGGMGVVGAWVDKPFWQMVCVCVWESAVLCVVCGRLRAGMWNLAGRQAGEKATGARVGLGLCSCGGGA